ACHVTDRSSRGEIRDGLEQQRRLADARIPAEQHDGPRHEPPAEHAVELAEPALEPLDPGRPERIEPRELDPARILRALGPRRTAVRSRGLDHRVPRAAIRALSLPLRLAGAACLADVYRLRFRHARSIADRTSAGPALENGVRHDFRGNRCQTPFFEIR